MSEKSKSLTRTGSGPLVPGYPTTALPVNPPTYVSAFTANLRMKVSDVLYTRMNAIATQHLQLQNTLHSIDRVRMNRESTLAEWDDLDNRLVDEQDERDHKRAMNRLRRRQELAAAERDLLRQTRSHEIEDVHHRRKLDDLYAPAAPKPSASESTAVSQFRAMMREMHALKDAAREEIDRMNARTDMTQAERDEEIFKINAAIAQFAQHVASTGELPDDMRRQVLDAFDRT